MSSIICEFCNKTYSSKSSLNNHQKTTKRCIEIQKSMNKNNNILEFKCDYCNKIFTTRQNIKNHENICQNKKEHFLKENEMKENKKKYENRMEELEIQNKKYFIEIEKLKEINKERENQNKNYFEEIQKLREIISEFKQNKKYLEEIQNLREINAGLKGELKIANKASECVYEIAKQPKNITTTNNSKTLNINTSLDFNDIDKIKEIIDTKYNINHFLCGQKGFAHFAAQNLLKDDDGNYNYTCTDPSRQIFKFKNIKGEIEKDIEAKKLTNYLIEGGIKDKARDISLSWCKNDEKIDPDKLMVVTEKQESILSISQNNNDFKKELASLVTI
jgi:hypothetical protein